MNTFCRITILGIFITINGSAQALLDTPLSSMREESLTDFLAEFEKTHAVKVFYLDDWMSEYHVGPQFNGYTLGKMLDELLQGSSLTFDFMFNYALIFSKDPTDAIKRESILHNAIIQRKAISQRVIGSKQDSKSGKPVVLKGSVRDLDSDRVIEGVTVRVNDTEEKITDPAGHFQFSLWPGTYVLTFDCPQYDDNVIDLQLYESGELTIEMQETPTILQEVVISDDIILDRSIGKTNLSMTQIKRTPLFFGEVDVIKHVQSQAGVTSVGEIASGFNVRGGSVDQNLVLYDDVPVFNTSHALGFFTAFNPDAIGEVVFYRGGIPAQFGGRVSSVLNIVSRQGDLSRWTGSGGIGIISSYFTVGGPIRNDTSAILISMRSTYSNWMLKAIKSNYEDVENTSVDFYDGSIKFNHQFDKKSKLTVSGYNSNDQFSLADDTTFYWRNTCTSARFDHTVSDRLFVSTTLSYGRYDFKVAENHPSTAFNFRYSVSNPSFKIDLQIDGHHSLSFGVHNTFYRFQPGILKPESAQSTIPLKRMDPENSVETALYLADGFNVTKNLFVDAGFRLSMFNRYGPEMVYQYRNDAPRDVRNIQDSVLYRKGQISKTYVFAEPRITLRYSVGSNTSVKVGYHRMVQYMHLITNTTAITPMDIWQSSNAYFKPQVADQISTGIFRNFVNNMYETFVEGYVKKVEGSLDFKDGADLILNPNLETALISTTGTAYGVEFSAAKVQGRFQASLNYTYSRSFRQADSRFDEEKVNDGMRYAANQDQPHVGNVNWRYAISRRIFFSGNFVYHTGRPVSLPSSVYSVDGIPVSNFSERNTYRIPDYHRLDLAFIFEGNHKRKKVLSGHWIFSFYNVYGRKNAYSVFFADDGTGFLKPYRLSVIGTMIPSVTYSFKF